ncbi:Branchpoint-bridging protein [Bienertia sinuspersici]
MYIDGLVRIKIVVGLRYPLKDNVKLKLRRGECIKVPVKYERLPIFCFICGCLGHSDKDCDEKKGELSPIKRHGTFMRASPLKPPKVNQLGVKDATNLKQRRLFVAKPMEEKNNLDSQQVEEVANKLGAVEVDENRVQESSLSTTGQKDKNEECIKMSQ